MGQQDGTPVDCGEIGRRVAFSRMLSGLSADAVWRDLGISPRLLELYEGGAYPVPPGHIDALARAFGTTPAALSDSAGTPRGPAA